MPPAARTPAAGGQPDRPQFSVAAGDERRSRRAPDQERRCIEALAQVVGEDRRDPRRGRPRRLGKQAVGAFGDPPRAEHESLDLVLREHERREHEARSQDVAHARFAVDMGTLRRQRRDVPVERPQAYATGLRKGGPCDPVAVPAEGGLEQVEQPSRARSKCLLKVGARRGSRTRMSEVGCMRSEMSSYCDSYTYALKPEKR